MNDNWPAATWHGMLAFALCLLLSACASQPDGSHSFTVAANDRKPGVWKLDGLAGSGRIDLTLRLRGDSTTAALASLRFNYRDERFWGDSVSFDDRTCRGAYTIALAHGGRQEWLTDYLSTRLPWEQTARLRLEWRSDGRFALTVNGREQKILDSVARIGNMAVVVQYGEAIIDNLTYTKLAANTPLLAENIE